MTRSLFLKLALLLAFSLPVAGQSSFTRGEVLVTGYREESAVEDGVPIIFIRSNLRLHRPDGSFARELATSTGRLFFREPLVLSDTVLVPMQIPDAIERFAADGTLLTPFTTAVQRVTYLSPGRNGGIIASNVSGEVYVFAADGTLTAFRDFTQDPPARGIDLASDGCTLFLHGGWRDRSLGQLPEHASSVPRTTVCALFECVPDLA
jgi:hypothetical protein